MVCNGTLNMLSSSFFTEFCLCVFTHTCSQELINLQSLYFSQCEVGSVSSVSVGDCLCLSSIVTFFSSAKKKKIAEKLCCN